MEAPDSEAQLPGVGCADVICRVLPLGGLYLEGFAGMNRDSDLLGSMDSVLAMCIAPGGVLANRREVMFLLQKRLMEWRGPCVPFFFLLFPFVSKCLLSVCHAPDPVLRAADKRVCSSLSRR